MEKENYLGVDLETIHHYQLENKALKAEIKQLQKEKLKFLKTVEGQKIYEEKYKQSQHRFKTIFKQSTLGNKILDADLRIIDINAATISMLGYSNKLDLLNRKIIEFSHPDFIKPWSDLQKALWAKRIPAFSIDTCLVKKDGTTIWCHVTSILFKDDNRTLGFTVLENVTDRKSLEEKSRRLYEAQEMIMYMVAHDLKNPLHIIKTLATFIRNDREEKKKDLHLALIEQTTHRAQTIINDLILIGELESNKPEIEKADIREVIKPLAEMMRFTAMEKEVTIVNHVPTDPVVASVNRERIGRALENLLSNAIKFSMPGGQIKIVLEQEQSFFLIKVIDQGIGIPSPMQALVFNRFTKAGRKGTKGEETTGLGLFITKRIVETHSGNIWLESKQNEGTTFFIKIPLSEQESNVLHTS